VGKTDGKNDGGDGGDAVGSFVFLRRVKDDFGFCDVVGRRDCRGRGRGDGNGIKDPFVEVKDEAGFCDDDSYNSDVKIGKEDTGLNWTYI
jgi:hypothetical protein